MLEGSNLENMPSIIEREKFGIKVERIVGIDEETLKQIVGVENASFPEGMRPSPEEIREVLENTNGIHLVVKNEKGDIVGYLSSLRQTEEYKELSKYDPEFENSPESLYLESIAVMPGKRNLKILNDLVRSLGELARESGYKKITMHARVENGLSRVSQKRYGARLLRRIERWYKFNKPFDYLEINLSGEEEK